MAAVQRYDKAQLGAYYDRIGLSPTGRLFTVVGLHPQAQMQFLGILQKHQLMKIPFENLTLHYSWHRVIDLHPHHLFNKIVCSSGRGGYCMENNSLFHTVLVSLGYNVHMVGARVFDNDSSKYGGFSHCLNIVTIGEDRYAVDVCFGSRVPVLPLNLCDGEVQRHSDPGQMRVRFAAIPQGLSTNSKLWIYEHRANDKAGWIPQYCFPDLEFLPEDIRAMNWGPAKSPSSFFTQKVVCVKFTTDQEKYLPTQTGSRLAEDNSQPDQAGAIDGAVIIDGDVLRWRKRGVIVWERKFLNDQERIDALENYFNISLGDDEKRAIKGCIGEIRAKSAPSSS